MIKVELPDEAFWAGVGFCLVFVLTSAFRYIRWQGTVLTKKEHSVICEANQKAILSGQQGVVEMLKEQNTTASEYRKVSTVTMNELKDDVGALKTDVAVLKATQGAR